MLIEESNRRVAKVVIVRKGIILLPLAHLGQTLNVSGTARNNVHGRLGVVHTRRIRHVLVHGQEALRVVDVPKHTEVHAVLVHDALKGILAGLAGAAAGRVPRAVTRDDDPRCHGAVDRRQVRLEEVELLVLDAKGSAVETGAAAGPVGGLGEVGLGVDHDDVHHAVLERVPEGREGQLAGLVGVDLGVAAGGQGLEGRGHVAAEAHHEVGKVLLAVRAQVVGVGQLLAAGLVVAGAGHVGLAAGDGGELVVEVLEDGLVGVLAVEDVARFEEPVVGVGQVAWVDDELEVVDGLGEAGDGGVVHGGRDVGDEVALGGIALDGVSILAVDAQIDDGIHGKGRLVARETRAEELLNARRVGGYDFIVVLGCRVQVVECNRVGPGPRRRVCEGSGRAGLLGKVVRRGAIVDTDLVKVCECIP